MELYGIWLILGGWELCLGDVVSLMMLLAP